MPQAWCALDGFVASTTPVHELPTLDHRAPNTEHVTNVGADKGGKMTHDIAETSDAAPRTYADAGPLSAELAETNT